MDLRSVRSPRARLRASILATGPGYRLWVRRNFGGRLRPLRAPAPRPCCAVLRGRDEVLEAAREAEEIGLPAFGIREKFWDGLAAVSTVLARSDRREEVLDAGAELYSPILPWLSLYGYRRLRGCNTAFDSTRIHGRSIVYEPGDVTSTGYRDGQFAAVTCQSVIEHGVATARFFREMGRIIRREGTLVLSTDYWETPVDSGGRVEFGSPVKVFTPPEIAALADLAGAHGFRLLAPLDLRCGDRVVRWGGLAYTFVLLAFARRG